MKAAAVLLFAAGVTTAATLPVHHNAQGLAIRQDVSAEVIDDSEAADAADAEAEDADAADAEAADAEAADAEAADAEAEDAEAEDVNAEDVNVEDLNIDDLNNVDLNAIGGLGIQDLLALNLNDLINFQLLGLDPNLLALGINNIFDGFFPGFLTVDALGALDVGQLLELMIVSQTLFNAQAFGFINQAQLINLFATGFIGNVLPFGFGGQVAVDLGALGLGGFGGAFSQNAFGSGVDVNANDALNGLDLSGAAAAAPDVASATDVAVAASSADAAAADDSGFTAEEIAGFTR